MFFSDKGGAISAEQMVVWFLIISMFVVLIFVYTEFGFGGIIDKGACHSSVVYRSTINLGPIQSSKIIPLQCETEKICLTMSGERCEVLGKSNLDNYILMHNFPKNKKPEEEVMDVFANSMYDCHSMLGEGKLSFMPNSLWRENYCLICSRIALDGEAKEKVSEINIGEFYKYLGEKKTSSGKTYLEYLYPGWTNWADSRNLFKALQEESDDEDFKKLKFENWVLDLSREEGFVVISQMAPPGTIGSYALSGFAFVGGTALLATGVGAPLGASLLVGGGAGTVSLWYSHPEAGGSDYSAPTVDYFDGDKLKKLGCSSFETAV